MDHIEKTESYFFQVSTQKLFLTSLKQLLTEANEYQDLRLKDLIKGLERQIRIKSIDAIPKQYLMHEMTREQAEQLIVQCSQHDDDRMKLILKKMHVTLKYIEHKQRQKLSWWQFIFNAFTAEDLETKMKRQGYWPGYKDNQDMCSSQKRYLSEFPSKKKNE